MNCSRFRFLIQQKFDMDLAPQEERVVVAHLESCESCAKFHHQLQQVILAAEEVPLPDEMLPQKEGELARLIQQQLPQGKPSPFAFLEDFLAKFTGKKNQSQQPAESPFPHRSNLGAMGDGSNGSRKKGVAAAAEAEDHNAMGSRLKQMNRNQGDQDGLPGNGANNYESREMQSQTRSLGEKFGMAAPSESGEEHGLTLAESIRRKISETTKPPGDDFDDQPQQPPVTSDSWQGAPQPGFAPPPGAQSGFANPNQQSFQGGPSGGFAPPQQNFQGAPATFASAPQPGFANAPQGAFQPGAQPGQGAPGFAQSPFEQSAQVGQAPMGWAAPAQDAANSWGAAQANSPPTQNAPDGGSWGAAAWDQGAQGVPTQTQSPAPAQNQEWSGQNNAPAAWNAPPADNAQGWTTPTNPAMQQSPLQQGGQGANPGWGAPPQAGAPSQESWQGAQPTAVAQNSAMQPTDSWSGGGNQAPPSFAPNVPAAPSSNDSWAGNNAPNSAPQNAPVVANSWGGGNQQPAWGQPAGNDWNSQPGAVNAPTAQAQGQSNAQAQAPSPAAPGWEQPAPAQSSPAAAWGDAPKGAAWGQPSDANNWGGPNGGEGNGAEAPKAEVKRATVQPAFDLKAELVETGTWKAFAPAEPLGPRMTPALPKAEAPPPGQAAPADNRWDIPIQERMKMANAGGGAAAPAPAPVQPAAYAPPAMPVQQPTPVQAPAPIAPPAAGWEYSGQAGGPTVGNAPEGGHTKSGWDFPVYESDEVLTGPGWGAPPKPPQVAEQNSGMGELGAAIGDVARGAAPQSQAPVVAPANAAQAQTAGAPNSWDLSIQERQQLQQQQAAAQPQFDPGEQQFAPGQPVPGQGWGGPPAQPQQAPGGDQNGWGVPAAAPAWGAPTQAQAPAPAPAPTPNPIAPPAADARQKLFAPIDDNAMDKLFSDHLGIQDAAPATREAAPAQPPAFQDPSRAAANWEQQQQQATQQAPQPAPAPPAAPQWGAPAAPQWGAPPAFAPGNGQSAPNGGANPPAAPPPVPVAVPAAKAGLFNLGDDDMDKLFGDHLGIQEPTQSPANAAPEPINMAQGQQGSSTWNKLDPQNPQQELTNPAWGQPPQQPAAQSWGQPPAASPAQAPVPAPAPWGNPPAVNDAQAWGAPPAAAPAWGQPSAQAPGVAQPPAQPPANPFAAMANNQYGQPPAQPPQISPVQSAAQSPAPVAPQKPANAGLFAIDDSVIDKIFSDNLGVSEGQSRPAESQPTGAPPPKIEGVGRLDSRVDHNQDAGSGRISSIGKFLLDQKDMEKLGKLSAADLSDSSMRILTQEAAGELTTLLHHIASQNSAVIGSVIVGHDGLLIANTLPPEIEAESHGVWALGVYMNTAHVVKKMGQNRVHQIVSKTPKGYLVIADFGGGLLVVVSDGKDTDTLIPLMRSITQLVVQ